MSEETKEPELTEFQMRAKLALKISTLAKEFGAVKEDGKNSHQKFNFISSNQMVALNRTHFANAGIAIFPEVDGYTDEHYKTAKGASGIRSTVRMNFEIIDTETGYSIVKKFVGTDQDTGGKSQAQAVTECKKRFYFNLFQVSSKEEVDPDSKTTEGGAKVNPKVEEARNLLDQVTKAGASEEQLAELAGLRTIKTIDKCIETAGFMLAELKGEVK